MAIQPYTKTAVRYPRLLGVPVAQSAYELLGELAEQRGMTKASLTRQIIRDWMSERGMAFPTED